MKDEIVARISFQLTIFFRGTFSFQLSYVDFFQQIVYIDIQMHNSKNLGSPYCNLKVIISVTLNIF